MVIEQQQIRRLQRIQVEGLFGIYNHRIDLKLDSRVTLLHGPNGVGKTTILKMVNALLTEHVSYFRDVPFKQLSLDFDDGTALQITKGSANLEDGEIKLTANDKFHSMPINLAASRAEVIGLKVESLQQVSKGKWIDLRDGELLTDAEVEQRYGRFFDLNLLNEREFADTINIQKTDKSWLGDFLSSTESYFIEAQRLEGLGRGHYHSYYHSRQPHYHSRQHSRQGKTYSQVIECSRELKHRIDETMVEYGRQAQELDQSFPQRLLRRDPEINDLPVDEIDRRMSHIYEKTEELKTMGILDETPIHQFESPAPIDKSQAGVMTLYVNDTEKKLQVLKDLANRVRFLLTSLNGKFRYKKLRIDRDIGLSVSGERGGDPLPLESLSSGEQHELILHYNLLFRVSRNTIVLLDEPELSLHIDWQDKFLSDLMETIKLSEFDAIVATHSPYIVGENDKLMVELSG